MKLGFWMIGMPNWSSAEIAQQAARHGYDGVDLRIGRTDWNRSQINPVNLLVTASDEEVTTTRDAFETAGVEIASLLCYNSMPHLGTEAAWRRFEEEIAAHAELARRLGITRIRPHIEEAPDETVWPRRWPELLDRYYAAIVSVLDRYPGMDAVIQNHIERASARELCEGAERNGDPRLGVELSPDHALVMQEDVVALVEQHAPRIRKICWADRKVVQRDLGRFDGEFYYVRYEACMPGEGKVPARRLMSALAANGFDGYVSLKWEKSAWYGAHLPTPESALEAFPAYITGLPGFERSAA